MLGRVDEYGSGRVRLPAGYKEDADIAYAQPVFVECKISGWRNKFGSSTTAPPAAAATTAWHAHSTIVLLRREGEVSLHSSSCFKVKPASACHV
jgi:hypothetical protein